RDDLELRLGHRPRTVRSNGRRQKAQCGWNGTGTVDRKRVALVTVLVNSWVVPLDPAAAEPLYAQLAAHIAAQIGQGVYRPGERIPSVRRLRDQHAVSMTTVLEACRVLEDRGLVRSRPQSGYY